MSVATLLQTIDNHSRTKGAKINRKVREHDAPIRVALTAWLYGIVNKETALRRHEFAVGHGTVGYADLCVCANDSLNGYEIKSGRDSLARLPRQVSYYDKVFDTSTLVTSPEHFNRSQDIVPSHWGLMVAQYANEKEVALVEIRIAKRNPDTDIQHALWLLWREEALELLTRLEPNHKLKYANRRKLYAALQNSTSAFVLRQLIISKLRCRPQFWWNFQVPSKLV